MPVTINYLIMIWDVKIYLAKIKDCKGKDLRLIEQEKFANKNPAIKSFSRTVLKGAN